MITRKIDPSDPRVGFVSKWVERLAAELDELIVITWHTSISESLPANVRLLSLGTDTFFIFKIIKLNIHVTQNIRRANGLLCHQMPEYTLVAGPVARIFGKRVVTWYTHGKVSLRLRLATLFSNTILSASRRSFRLKTKKLKVVGHGIDIERFAPLKIKNQKSKIKNVFSIVTIGRISPTKDIESMIKSVYVLKEEGITGITLDVYGDVGLKRHRPYLESLVQMIGTMNLSNEVKLRGPVEHEKVSEILRKADLFVNLSGTGSLDKAVLEAMASGCAVFTSNEAFSQALPSELIIENNQPDILADKIKWLMKMSVEKDDELRSSLRNQIVQNHNIDTLVKRIIDEFE